MTSPYGLSFDGAAWPWSLQGSCDWWAIVDASGRYVSDACVEGETDEFRALAAALRAGTDVRFRRLAAKLVDGTWQLWSPRNSCGGHAELAADRAVELADRIERAIARAA